MSKQLFNEIGLERPTTTVNPGGSTIMYIKNATSGDIAAGKVVLLDSSANTSDTEVKDYTQFIVPPGGSAAAAGTTSTCRIFGLTLEDIAEDRKGAVMLRGSALATVQRVTTNINNTTGNGLISVGSVGTAGNLVSAGDAGTGVYAKVVALYRGSTALTTATSALRPVNFNGVEGFFSCELP